MDENPALKPPLALTGATGFIGRELQRQLLAAGYPVRALVRPDSDRRRHLLAGVEAVTVALDDVAGVTAALAGIDTVIYCAGAVRGWTASDFAPANVTGLQTFCAVAASRVRPPRILMISSLAASRPNLSAYARSKFEGEELLRSLPALHWLIMRPPAVYGPGDREMLPLFRAVRAGLALIVGPPAQRLSLLHVADLARAVVVCLAQPDAGDREIFELDDGHAHGYGWDDIIAAARGRRPALKIFVPPAILGAIAAVNEVVSRWLQRPPMLTAGKVRELSEASWLCDNSRFCAATGWVPQLQLRAGMSQLFDGLEANGDDIGIVT